MGKYDVGGAPVNHYDVGEGVCQSYIIGGGSHPLPSTLAIQINFIFEILG